MARADREALYQIFQNQLGSLSDVTSAEVPNPHYDANLSSLNAEGFGGYNPLGGSPTTTSYSSAMLNSILPGATISPYMAVGGDNLTNTPSPMESGFTVRHGGVIAHYDGSGRLVRTEREEDDSWLMKAMRVGMPALSLGVMGGAAFAPEALGSIGAGGAGTTGGTAAGGAVPAAGGPGYFGGISSTPAAAVPGMGGGAGLTIGAAGPLAAGSAMMPTLGAAGTAALAAGGGAAASAATGGGLSGLLRSIRGGGGGDGEGGSDLGLLASLINAYSQNRQGSAQEDWADRLYQDRSQFLERLARTYSNPEEYLSGPEYTAAAGITLDQLQRKDAARGRLATDVERQKLMQDYALQSLGNYRSGLATAAGLSPTQGLADLSVTGQANKYGTFNAPISELARILEGNNSFDFDDLLDDIIGGWF